MWERLSDEAMWQRVTRRTVQLLRKGLSLEQMLSRGLNNQEAAGECLGG